MKKRWIFVLVALVVAIGVGAWFRAPNTTPTVRTVVLTPSSVEQTVSCNGVVEAVDGVGVFAPVACYIREVCVVAGQRVSKGDVLAMIDKETTLLHADDTATRIALAGMGEELLATADGIVAEVSAEPGKLLQLGTPCALLVRSDDLRVRIAIREKDLRVLREGMRVRISGDGFERPIYNGQLSEISCAASISGTSTIVAGLVCPDVGELDDSFRLGLTAKASVVVSVTENGYVIPFEAVVSDEEGSYVYLLQDGTAQRYNMNGAMPVAHGFLLSDVVLGESSVIVEPEKITDNGCAVVEAPF